MASRAEEGRVVVGQTMADTVGILLALADDSQRGTGFRLNEKEVSSFFISLCTTDVKFCFLKLNNDTLTERMEIGCK